MGTCAAPWLGRPRGGNVAPAYGAVGGVLDVAHWGAVGIVPKHLHGIAAPVEVMNAADDGIARPIH